MKITRSERWILSNQHRILEALYPNEARDIALARKAIESGYELEYEQICPCYKEDESLTTEQCTEVINILSMFDALKVAYQKLVDKSGIEAAKVAFRGFDGNNETEQMAYTQYLHDDQGKFHGIDRGDDFNSHSPLLPRYRSMLNEWNRLEDKYTLTKENIIQITKSY